MRVKNIPIPHRLHGGWRRPPVRTQIVGTELGQNLSLHRNFAQKPGGGAVDAHKRHRVGMRGTREHIVGAQMPAPGQARQTLTE